MLQIIITEQLFTEFNKNNLYISSMKNTMIKYFRGFTIVSVLIFSGDVYSQIQGNLFEKKNKAIFEQKLEILNQHLSNVKIEHEDERISVTFYEKGAAYRIDHLYLETLDSNQVYYSEEEKMVIIKCKSEDELDGKLRKFREGCIERHILKNEIIRAYFRFSLEVSGDRKEFINTFRELIIASQAHKH